MRVPPCFLDMELFFRESDEICRDECRRLLLLSVIFVSERERVSNDLMNQSCALEFGLNGLRKHRTANDGRMSNRSGWSNRLMR